MYSRGGYYGLVVVMPRLPPPRLQTLHRSHDNLKKSLSDCFHILYVDWYRWEDSWESKMGPVRLFIGLPNCPILLFDKCGGCLWLFTTLCFVIYYNKNWPVLCHYFEYWSFLRLIHMGAGGGGGVILLILTNYWMLSYEVMDCGSWGNCLGVSSHVVFCATMVMTGT